ncbi:hypothetical protein [Commensalibacter nepenthis]|uniref:Uncharacterized protein n=1 Tax=Commensalibacter nepenthis TaxID=3043872 RepID=A0ABT6Q994_9PROT|nr:hypothetical protein [Commensalibacter sp. TBRC 10068]MDI2113332.1 hypothetical protein [Commensalibacter sp. TBRC 10068]
MMLEQQENIVTSQKWRHKHLILRYFMLGVFSILALFFLFVVGVWVFVNTSTGKNYIATEIQKHTNDRIQILGITGFVPTHMNIAEMQFKNVEIGTWLDVKQKQLNWSPWALLQEKISASVERKNGKEYMEKNIMHLWCLCIFQFGYQNIQPLPVMTNCEFILV